MRKSLIKFFGCILSFVLFANTVAAKPTISTNVGESVYLFKDSIVASFAKQLPQMIEKVSPACVLITTYDLLPSGNGAMASGVCVSENGLIMTAGHLTVPNGHYAITFSDGRQVPAKGLGKIGSLDLGLLQITTDGKYPFAHLGWAAALKPGEPCFSISYPGSFLTKKVAKLGYVEEVLLKGEGNIKERHLKTTCLMEPGDSGGPVFNMNGEVVGIRSYIGLGLDENYDVPVDLYRMYWDALHKPVKYLVYPEKNKTTPKDITNLRMLFSRSSIKKSLHENANHNHLNSYTAIIESTEGQILGTVVSAKGLTSHKKYLQHSYIISKNSAVGKKPIVKILGKQLTASIVYRDKENDLVLLAIDKVKAAIKLKEKPAADEVGEVLISPVAQNNIRTSIMGTPVFDLAGKYSSGFLGVSVALKQNKVTVTSVQPNTAASKAGLKIGDEMLYIDKIQVKTPTDFIQELEHKWPGDTIKIVRAGTQSNETLSIVLLARKYKRLNHVAERFTDGRSKRRDGFQQVFIHDGHIKPAECGSPIFNTKGEFVGMNIARYSRTSSIAFSNRHLAAFLQLAIVHFNQNN